MTDKAVRQLQHEAATDLLERLNTLEAVGEGELGEVALEVRDAFRHLRPSAEAVLAQH